MPRRGALTAIVLLTDPPALKTNVSAPLPPISFSMPVAVMLLVPSETVTLPAPVRVKVSVPEKAEKSSVSVPAAPLIVSPQVKVLPEDVEALNVKVSAPDVPVTARSV